MTNNPKMTSIVSNIGLYIAFFCIGLGLISVISSNWQEIPATAKLVIYFLLLGLSSLWTYKSQTGNKNNLETSIILNAVLIMAGLGLIIQIYNIQIPYYTIGLIWSFLTLPLIIATHKKILPLVWIPILAWSFSVFTQNTPYFQILFRYLIQRPILYIITINAILVLCFNLLKVFAPQRLSHFISAFKFWMVFSLAFLVFQLDFFPDFFFFSGILVKMLYPISEPTLNIHLLYGLVGLFLATVILIEYKLKLSHLFSSILAITLFYTFFQLKFAFGYNDLSGMIYTLLVLLTIGVSGYIGKSIRRINTAATLAAIRIFIGYIQVFGSLLMTGVGLIASGIVLLIFIYGIKYIRRFTKSTLKA